LDSLVASLLSGWVMLHDLSHAVGVEQLTNRKYETVHRERDKNAHTRTHTHFLSHTHTHVVGSCMNDTNEKKETLAAAKTDEQCG
jgi:hypothetical protein